MVYNSKKWCTMCPMVHKCPYFLIPWCTNASREVQTDRETDRLNRWELLSSDFLSSPNFLHNKQMQSNAEEPIEEILKTAWNWVLFWESLNSVSTDSKYLGPSRKGGGLFKVYTCFVFFFFFLRFLGKQFLPDDSSLCSTSGSCITLNHDRTTRHVWTWL